MIALLENNREEIAELCRTYGVTSLEVFGSAVEGTFDDATSDVDFLLEIEGASPGLARRFIGFADALEALLGKNVDLTFPEALSNPFLQHTVNAHREVIFGDRDCQAAA